MSEEKRSICRSEQLNKFLYEVIHSAFKNGVGKTLTIVDAISENEVRRKAIHDLVEQAIWGVYMDITREIEFATSCLRKELGEPIPDKCGEVKRQSIFEL